MLSPDAVLPTSLDKPQSLLNGLVSQWTSQISPFVTSDTNSFIPAVRQTIELTKGNVEKQVLKTLRLLYPHLAQLTITKLQRISGALTNAVFFVTLSNNQRFVLRVYGSGCDQLLDRANELLWLARLTPLKIGAKLLGTFDNGRFEEYLPSTTLTHACLRDPTTSHQIAILLARLHSIVQIHPPPVSSSPQSINPALEIWPQIRKWYSLLGGTFDASAKTVAGITWKEIETYQQFLDKVHSPTVFAHNDLQYGNILRLNSTGDLVAVDFEYAGYNPRGYDLANHLIEWQYNYHGAQPALASPQQAPNRQQRTAFVKAYLSAHHLKSTTTVDQLLYEIDCWSVICHLCWGLWGLIQLKQSDIDFDYAAYSTQRLAMFRQALNKVNSSLPH
ncbi:kinase-like domain-containing protein [Chlamydoabsidia padenii]|nr:kinase-like domain-containing protein [Chlamydoabsidia padenii]